MMVPVSPSVVLMLLFFLNNLGRKPYVGLEVPRAKHGSHVC